MGPRLISLATGVVLVASSLAGTTAAGAHEGHIRRQGTPVTASAPQPPAGFSDTVVASAQAPTAVAWTPDGRMIVTSKAGQVRVGEDEDGPLDVALDLSAATCAQGERGLVGIAVDPGFAQNRFVYVYWTHRTRGSCTRPAPANRVTRFELGDDNQVVRGSQTVILDHIVSPEAHHIAGDLEFGADGYLYVSVGDGVCALTGERRCGAQDDNSQVRGLPHGKILRVTRRGLPVADNPYADHRRARRCTRPSGVPAGTGPCAEIFAMGLRNPFRIARRPGTSSFFVNDVGLHTWEEVNRLRKGANYGWNVREGRCRRDSATDCGPTTVHQPDPRLPPPERLSVDHRRRLRARRPVARFRRRLSLLRLRLWSPLPARPAARRPLPTHGVPRGRARSDPPPVRPARRRNRALLPQLLRQPGPPRHDHWGNTPPEAEVRWTPDGTHGDLRRVGELRPDSGEQIASYAWTFGDGTSATTTTPTTTHTYASEGTFTASLVVTDSRGLASAPATVQVESGEHAPTLEVTGIAPSYAVGDPILLELAATDAEDGTLPASSITWELRRRHANHSHPYVDPMTGDTVSAAYPRPEDLQAAGESRLLLVATATDSAGLSVTARRVLRPRRVELTFRTDPGGGRIVLQGTPVTVPARVVSWAGFRFPVSAPDQRFRRHPPCVPSLVRRRGAGHDLVTPARPTTFVATFRRLRGSSRMLN